MAAEAAPRKRVAVMQPYFLPYAGYFRLFAAVDEFVIYDCVQFPRRGRVHRTEVPGADGAPQWLTLPLARQPRDIRIGQLAFAPDARLSFDARLAALPLLATATGAGADATRALLSAPLDDVTDFLQSTLSAVAARMGFQPAIRRSSSLAIDPVLRGQDRVIAIATAVGATHYLNAPGGRALYRAEDFAAHGLVLEFLSPYRGRGMHLLPALLQWSNAELRADVLSQLQVETA
jgi:hypothetical protein